MKNFEIIKELGKGAFASVFQVRRLADKKIYALKRVKLSAECICILLPRGLKK